MERVHSVVDEIEVIREVASELSENMEVLLGIFKGAHAAFLISQLLIICLADSSSVRIATMLGIFVGCLLAPIHIALGYIFRGRLRSLVGHLDEIDEDISNNQTT